MVGLIGGGVALLAFLAWELRQSHPLLDIRVFRSRALSTGSVNLLLVFAVMFGLFLVLVQYLQAVLGYSALGASAGLLPMALVLMPLSTYSPTIAARFGTKATLLTGTALFGVGLAMMAMMASVDGGYLSILPGLLVLAAGMGLAMTPSTTAITESLPVEKQGVASALNDTVREVGGALGVALLGSVLSSGYQSSISSTAEQLPAALRQPVEDGIGTALAVSPQLGDDATTVVNAARQAFVDGLADIAVGRGGVGGDRLRLRRRAGAGAPECAGPRGRAGGRRAGGGARRRALTCKRGQPCRPWTSMLPAGSCRRWPTTTPPSITPQPSCGA